MKIKLFKSIFVFACVLFLTAPFLSACNITKYTEDLRMLSDTERTVLSISGTDALGRKVAAADAMIDGNEVGLFYFLWLGAHSGGQTSVYDITELLEYNPDALYSNADNNPDSPVGQYHFWGEPLYGYYYAADPWVLTRHVELFVAQGLDFLLFDTTNGPIYDNVVKELLKVLDTYQKQGWNVPKIGFMCNSGMKSTVSGIYDLFYDSASANYYPDLWYSPDGKPFICADTKYFNSEIPADKKLMDFFDMRAAQWPDNKSYNEENFPWMDWNFPQKNFNGTMSVSVAQHTSSKMSETDSNWGRGYDYFLDENVSAKAVEGRNIQNQWENVFNSNADADRENVNRVFVTGWNEWTAIKFKGSGDSVYFVDLFNMEYSRDIEMMKGGYGDNFYMQLTSNIKKFKFTEQKKYHSPVATVNDGKIEWEGVNTYRDFEGDALKRDCRGYIANLQYSDDSNRNDIIGVQTVCDKNNLYFRIETAAEITDFSSGDTDWMNIWISTDSAKTGYDYVINREYGKLTKIVTGNYAEKSDVVIEVNGKIMTVTVPLAAVGLTGKNPAFAFKVSDNVDSSDRMNFYIQGDSAPIGANNYTFGYFV